MVGSPQAGLAAVKQDVVIGAAAPGGKVEYRQSLAASFLFKFLAHAAIMLEQDAPEEVAFTPDMPETHRWGLRPPVLLGVVESGKTPLLFTLVW